MVARRVLGWFLLVSGCGGAAVPLEGMALRDTLLASPQIVAALTPTDRQTLAERFHRAALAQYAELAPVERRETPLAALRNLDSERRQADLEAWLIVAANQVGEGSLLVAETLETTAGAAEGALEVAVEEDGILQPAEEHALAGEPGRLLRRLADRHATRNVVIVRQEPWALAISEGTLWVNGAFLVALDGGAAAVPGAAVASAGAAATRESSATGEISVVAIRPSVAWLTTNHSDVAACVGFLDARCTACLAEALQCDQTPTLVDYITFAEECVFAQTNATNAEAVCAAALLSVPETRACVETNNSSCLAPGEDIRQTGIAQGFVIGLGCQALLNLCIADPAYIETPPPSSSCGRINSCDSQRSCNSCSSGSCSSCGSSSSSFCSAAVSPNPFNPVGWILCTAPIGFLSYQGRRRKRRR